MVFLRKLTRRAFLLLLLAGVVYGAWRWGPLHFPRFGERIGVVPASRPPDPGASREVADSVLATLQEIRERGGGRMAVGSREVTSVLRYSLPGLIPPGIRDPEVTLREGQVHLSAEVIVAAFPDLPDLGPIMGILPDTLRVVLHASLTPFDTEDSALLVQGIEASRIPIPRRLIPEILTAMGRVDRPGLPPEALAVPLPAGLASAYILADSLILSSLP
jgi:hypothetical protein